MLILPFTTESVLAGLSMNFGMFENAQVIAAPPLVRAIFRLPQPGSTPTKKRSKAAAKEVSA